MDSMKQIVQRHFWDGKILKYKLFIIIFLCSFKRNLLTKD